MVTKPLWWRELSDQTAVFLHAVTLKSASATKRNGDTVNGFRNGRSLILISLKRTAVDYTSSDQLQQPWERNSYPDRARPQIIRRMYNDPVFLDIETKSENDQVFSLRTGG